MSRKNKTRTSEDTIFTTITTPEDETIKPISFRADQTLFQKITILEKTRHESKSTVIKAAIDRSFSELILHTLHNKICDVIRKKYPESEAENGNIIRQMFVEDEDKDPHPFKTTSNTKIESIVKYSLKYNKYEDEHKTRYSVNRLLVEIIPQNDQRIKLKVAVVSVIKGNSDNISGDLFLKVSQSAGKNEMQTETTTNSKDMMSVNIFFEREAGVDFKEWSEQIEKDIEKLKVATDNIEKLFSTDKKLKTKEQDD